MIKPLPQPLLLSVVEGKVILQGETFDIDHIVTDTRKITASHNSLFIALAGPHYNAVHYLAEAYEKGIRMFLIQEEPTDTSSLKEATLILVKSTLKALQQIAAYQRRHFKGRVISLTGSNGKTIVKEWLSQILGEKYFHYKSPKSFNSQVGVPLSIMGIKEGHKLAILEAGISKPEEMENLETIIKPNLVIFTNLGSAHAEGFESKSQKLKEKAKLAKNADFIIYRKEHAEVAHFLEGNFADANLICWSDSVGVDYCLTVKQQDEQSKIVLLQPNLQMFTFTVLFSDQASLENIRHVIAAALSLGMTPPEIQKGLQNLRPLDMRMSIKQGINDCTLIDDTYSNDLEGLKVSLEFMQLQRPKRRRVLILSDFLQTNQADTYAAAADLIQQHRVDKVYAIGERITHLRDYEDLNCIFFKDTGDFLENLSLEDFRQDLILITGARKFQLERIVHQLEQKVHGTSLEINLNALAHNFHYYKRQLHPHTKVMVMVKAFAYGGGSAEIANMLEQVKADYLAVAYTDEGIYLRNHGITLPIMVLNPSPESFPLLFTHQLEPVVYSFSMLQQLGAFMEDKESAINIHLDCDTGMHRLGFMENEVEQLNGFLMQHPNLSVASIYTHLVGADDDHFKTFSQNQLDTFSRMAEQICSTLPDRPLLHALNSAGIINFPQSQFDMVRLGIGLYGVEVTGKHEPQLLAISTLRTTVSQIKTLPEGSTVGYSRKGQMPNGGKIATLAIGYADGYDRRFSNGKGHVLINGQKAPVIGNVCMDMTMVDITGLEVKEGDQAVIYGEGISLKELASSIGTIPYELLTNISSRVRRVYYSE
ncbi:bifunctional UDP-N-acetylmuramoyl-tripeptide:D-alanyl-D-alanine ligase/alanine racemase [Litoribacter alkaliphilus]|uniref:Alanine racemase n=1 Tax=Litoribacter ruber TaxID=702568 RepID=A0AAP2CFC4_9BACT|nr:bifunctional UDP-N-acetylmuramoyl-tripeptide:D-alanyl-D-alanine ligase/alanine racemase [Litoribacter alkaliphilus]MBS9523546.1 bifunctional UDP-N-acetylmuramoyl-tripeptide:D-alanyl-D-alanine ligase/alanine racemase [Litoribacter alkaliphilus]